LLGFFVVVSIPALTYARSQGVRVSRAPEVNEVKNSQTMALLEGHLNTESTPVTSTKLAIVDDTALSSEGDAQVYADAGTAGTGQISVYVVRKGDSLPAIAKMFGVSTNTILWANDIKGGKVSEGDQLVILPISGVKHTVKKGDTLKSIAALYKANVDDILSYNDITIETPLSPGDTIIVPDGEISTKPITTVKVAATGTSPYKKTASSAAFEPLLVNVSKYPSFPGYFAKPISGGLETQTLHGYNAVDLAAPAGTPIYAAAGGKVIISKTGGYNGGYGTYVTISHPNGTQTLYAHMSRNLVSVGQTVTQGQQIGAIGMTGKTTGPHVHFEIRGAKNPF
jgi:murein DD-endopeptidase MepM/ murein hydrolase activator NlpD